MTATSPVLLSNRPTRWNQGRLISLGLPVATALLLSVAFPPLGCWQVASFALAPLIYVAKRRPLGVGYLLYIWLIAFIYYVANLYWLSGITVAGYIALSIYCGFYLAVFFWLTHLLGRRSWLPAWVSAPMLFTSLEYLRGHLFTGFPWFTLGVAYANSPTILQCVSIFGAAGLSFLSVMTAAWLADVAWQFIHPKSKTNRMSLTIGTICVVAMWLMVWGYGSAHLHHAKFRIGPRIAVLQQNIPQSVKSDTSIQSQKQLFNSYFQLGLQAVRYHPDMVVWPETMVPGFLNPSWLAQSPAWFARGHGRLMLKMDQTFARRLSQFARRYHTAVLVGSSGVRFNKFGKISRMQNIAVLFTPRRGQVRKYYAKRHLVPFGEYLPFKESAPWLHHLLSYFTPFGPNGDYSLTPGDSWHHFTIHVADLRYVFGVPICYEDAMAKPARMFCQARDGSKGADFLVVISNDGWYQSRAELLQHMQLDQIRAVENRVSVARCVNGGYCGFISPTGRVIKLVAADGHHAFVTGVAVAALPLDSQITVFTRWGHWFAPVILGLTAFMMLAFGVDCLLFQRRRHKAVSSVESRSGSAAG